MSRRDNSGDRDSLDAGAPLLSDLSSDADRSAIAVRLDSPRGPNYVENYATDIHDAVEAAALSSSSEQARQLRHIENEVLPERAVHGQNVSWTSAYILIISRMMGSGIFATPGVVARSAGSIGLSMCVWVMGALVASLSAAVALEYGCMLPRSGGDKVYLEFVYRRPRFLVPTIIAIKAVLQFTTANNCIVFGQYLAYGLLKDPTNLARKLSSMGLLLTVAVIHGTFLKAGVRIQNALGWMKVGMMLFLILTALFVVITRFGRTNSGDIFPVSKEMQVAHLSQGLWEGSNWGWEVFSLALYKVHYAYAGAENANNVLNEVKDPVRMLLRVVPLSLISVCSLYLLVNSAFFLILPLQEMKDTGEMAAAAFFTRLFGSKIGGVLLPTLIAVSIAGNVMVAIFSLARFNQEIARQGHLPRIFASSKPFNAPLGGVVVNFVPAALIILFMPSSDVYSFLLKAEGYPGQISSLALACGIFLLRWKRPDLRRPFKAWRPVVLLRMAFCISLVLAPFVPGTSVGDNDLGLWKGTFALVGLGILLSATLYWFIWAKAIPTLLGYEIEERAGTMSDGTTYTSFQKVPSKR